VRTRGLPFAVPQRRRRVFVVGCLGDQRRAAEVLFECESVRRDTPPSRAKGQGTAADAQGSVGGGRWWDGGNTAGTLTKQNANGAQRMPDKDNFGAVIHPTMQVRRLTPVECERLQGFPDNFTNVPWRGKAEAPDGPRYKALGNSMAVPVMRWIGERINA
jgi:DNA (cytosine-5)-methyltransferase 1